MEPLNGYTVVDLSVGIAGAYCTKLLADGGATVIKVEPPEGDPLRRWSASGAEIKPGDDGALFSFLACSKHSVVADPEPDLDFVNALLAGADAVVWSRGSSVADHVVFTPPAIRSAHPHLTVTSITPFGLDGPWCDRPATEFTLQAWSGGIVGLGRGAADRAPVYVGGQVGEYLAGAYASAATLASRMRGGAELVDVSMLETQILGLTYYPVAYYEMLGRPWRDARRLTVPGIARAKDGLVDIGCGTAQQWFDLCAMTGHQDWIDEESPLSITQQANEKADDLYAWVESQTVDEIRDLATAFRIPNAPVANGANIVGLDHFEERGSFIVEPARRFRPARPSLPDDARGASCARTCAAAGRTHRALSPKRTYGSRKGLFGNRNVHFGGTAVQWVARAGYDDLLGRAVVHTHAGDARRRRDPCGVDAAPRRHPPHCGHTRHRRPVVGEVADLLGAEHEQEGVDPRPPQRRGPRSAQPPHRLMRRDRRELHPPRGGSDRA